MSIDNQGETGEGSVAGPAGRRRSVAALLGAVTLLGLAAFLAGCATTVSSRYERRPLSEGKGTYLMFERAVTRNGGASRTYSSRFDSTSGAEGFFTLDVQKSVTPESCAYGLILEYQGFEASDIRALTLRVDGSIYHLTDPPVVRTQFPMRGRKIQERYTFPLDPALVGSLREAGTIKLDYGYGTVNLTARQQHVLRSFLNDTAGLGDCGG
jgi:hypothetical protein